MIRRVLAFLLIGLPAACGKPSSEAESKQWSGEQPPKEVAIPAALSIGVTVDGVAKPALTAELLNGKTPDFVDSDRKAWLVVTRFLILQRCGDGYHLVPIQLPE